MEIVYKITGKIGNSTMETILREVIITDPEGKQILLDYMIVYPNLLEE